jgi:hypothetical protein
MQVQQECAVAGGAFCAALLAAVMPATAMAGGQSSGDVANRSYLNTSNRCAAAGFYSTILFQCAAHYLAFCRMHQLPDLALLLLLLLLPQVFLVDVRADKKKIRKAVQNMYDIQTKKINTLIRWAAQADSSNSS